MGEPIANMMKIAILLCLAAVAFCAPLGNTEVSDLFSQFKADFSKVYSEVNEEAMRFGIFTKTVDLIQEFNKNMAPTEGYTMGINQFSDMTPQEYKRYLNYNASSKKMDNVELLDIANLTSSIDWTTKGAVTPVKNQQSCGSCWAFSTTGSVEGALAIKGGPLVSLSEQELVDCAGSFGNQGCNGGLMDDGFKFVEKNGLALEKDYKYTAKDGTCNSAAEKAASGVAAGKVTSFKDVATGDCAQLMAAVTLGPVSVAIEADQSAFQNYQSGILSSGCGTTLDHGVLVVGFGTDGGKDYWKIKNSWDVTWGDKGYLRIAKSCTSSGRRLLGGGGGSSNGVCGVLTQPSYPIV